MKILLDMNLAPRWRAVLERHGHSCVHWAEVGDPRADDRAIMQWAAEHGYVVITHDLDFGAILAASQASAPSVLQVRTEDLLPEAMESLLIQALAEFAPDLETGALIVVHKDRSRARILPLSTKPLSSLKSR